MVGVSGQREAFSDTRVQTPGGVQLRGEVRLPSLDGIDPIEDPPPDTIGRVISFHRGLLGAGAGIGLLAGAVLARGGMLRHVAGGASGTLLGLGAAFGVARLGEVVSGRGASDSTAFVADVPGAGSTPRRGAAGERVRVVNWNVRDLIGPDGHVRTNDDAVDAIADVIAREQPDVLVLQELGQGSPAGGLVDGLAELADRLGATDAVLVPNGFRAGGGTKGGAVLTFDGARVQDARGIRHPDPGGDGFLRRLGALRTLLAGAGFGPARDAQEGGGYYPRTTADVLVTTAGGTDIRVLGVHLSGNGTSIGGTSDSSGHERQLGAVAGTLDAWQGPTLLLGDFNVRAGSATHAWERERLNDGGLEDAFATLGIEPPDARTYPSSAPARQIDRIYASDELVPVTARVASDASARAGSDHLPLVAEFEVR